MRTLARQCLVLLILTVGTACGQSARPPVKSEAAKSELPKSEAPMNAPAATANAEPASSPSARSDLAGALGLRGEMPLPAGLVPGGDCPAADSDAAEEIQAQARAFVPLQEGLTLAEIWTKTREERDYECLTQVKSISAAAIETTLSCDYPPRRGPFRRRICRADLRSAGMLHTAYGAVRVISASGEEEPETIRGATVFSLSSNEFARLKRTGAMTYHYVELGSSGQLSQDSVGQFHVEARETMEVIVNDRAVNVPVLKARGPVNSWFPGERE